MRSCSEIASQGSAFDIEVPTMEVSEVNFKADRVWKSRSEEDPIEKVCNISRAEILTALTHRQSIHVVSKEEPRLDAGIEKRTYLR